ncbi:glycoside hydrolase family 15 protein [Caldimonas sp. KR1-144]|uniref:glycoside hydrolase family 15 protein n=1 Tax=Caldimonas sp. KR1-144 TaxID=3400911 RepID=UPI003C049FA1
MTTAHAPGLEAWLEQQLRCSAQSMLACISPVAIVKHRPGFGQTVRPVPGAIVASTVLGDWKPDPDYFFHWFRDSAVVIDALRLLYVERRVGGVALQHLRDFTRFSLALNDLDGRAICAVPDRRAGVQAEFLQYLREDSELERLHGDAVAADVRVNADGTLDISRWSRPQHDGPPLRALALLRWVNEVRLDAPLLDELAELIRFDLAFTLRHWREPSYDIWEEESGHHYYTLRMSAQALAEGATWLQALGDAEGARRCREASRAALRLLDGYWNEDALGGYYRARRLADGRPSAKDLDIAVILAAIHAHGPGLDDAQAHGVADPRMHATLARLDALFASAYPINSAVNREAARSGRGTAMGRYAGDVYFSGGAYYFSTLGAAEFCFRAAQCSGDARDRRDWFERGDAYLATVRAYTPASGELSEQFDQRSGEQTSARQLAWSHAALISCASARRAAAAFEGSRPR